MLEKLNLPKDPIELIGQLKLVITEAEKQIEELTPKAEFYDEVTQSDDWTEMSKIVKSIETASRKKIGRNIMFALLRDMGVLRSGGWNHNEPYQQYVNRGYFRIVESTYNDYKTGEPRVGRKTVVSQKGLDYMIKLINGAENE